MIDMSRIYILVEYNGKWENVDGGFWRWLRVGMSKGFVVDMSINILELEETSYDRTSIDQSKYTIEITHKPVGDIFGDTITPTLISNDSNIIALMFLYKEKQGMTLHVINKEKYDKGKTIYVRGDDDLNSDGGDALGFHDDYFGCRINIEIPFVARITGFNLTPITDFNPTPEETVHEEVPNKDDGVDKVGDDVPEGGDEVRKGCDGVPEGGDGLHERVYDIRCQHSESEEARFVPLINSDSRRSDGSDLMAGQEVNQVIKGSCVCK
ncbi:hypothetical protein TIFTF001_013950 [Ficus carica]|uniref:Uncharacterized protein n=1 Tax=Ficus carica TaxID=3494 RepID=A0AA88D562_FICCA|nr:hypothetical protein TIFTF001_013950 [Ficus carica]